MKKVKLAVCVYLVIVLAGHINPIFASDEDRENVKIIANWASINYPDLFFSSYEKVLTNFGYSYVCFDLSHSCIGINGETSEVDVLLNGEISTAGALVPIMDLISTSRNGILNLSGNPVDTKIVSSIFSPGLGKTSEFLSFPEKVQTIVWEFVTGNDIDIDKPFEIVEKNENQLNYKLTLSLPLRGFTIIDTPSLKLSIQGTTIYSTSEIHGEWFTHVDDIDGASGLLLDFENKTLTITEDLNLYLILIGPMGHIGHLNVFSGNKLYFE